MKRGALEVRGQDSRRWDMAYGWRLELGGWCVGELGTWELGEAGRRRERSELGNSSQHQSKTRPVSDIGPFRTFKSLEGRLAHLLREGGIPMVRRAPVVVGNNVWIGVSLLGEVLLSSLHEPRGLSQSRLRRRTRAEARKGTSGEDTGQQQQEGEKRQASEGVSL